MRLNGWQRIGIVASVLWAIGLPIYLIYDENQSALRQAETAQRICLTFLNRPPSECSQQYREVYADFAAQFSWAYVGMLALCILVPLAFAWAAAYGLVRVARWIAGGSRKA